MCNVSVRNCFVLVRIPVAKGTDNKTTCTSHVPVTAALGSRHFTTTAVPVHDNLDLFLFFHNLKYAAKKNCLLGHMFVCIMSVYNISNTTSTDYNIYLYHIYYISYYYFNSMSIYHRF